MTDATTAASLEDLSEGSDVSGFRAGAVYLDATDRRIGARFTHLATGFTFDLIYIETAPQAFVWVNSFPTSDMGEPHTQEHLLLGKGNKGRYVASVESMSLAESSAFTAQWRTAYHFHTIAGVDVFWDVLEHKLDGLLHPDYSDEEIRREVRNFGVVADPKSGELRLEEKGTVYNEMVRSFESPNRLLWRKLGQMQYGEKHPLAMSAGGLPSAIREMTAEHIRTFHRENYHLGNMGMVAAFPRTVALQTILGKVDGALTRQAVGQPSGSVKTEADLPPPSSAAAGSVALVPYPHTNAQKPGAIMLAWPPALELSTREQLLVELFLAGFAGDSTTTLYKKLVDSESRELDLGATGVWAWMSSDQGNPIMMGISNVRADHLTDKGIATARDLVENELRAIAALPDDSPELAAMNERIRGRITETRRSLAKFMNSPPRFGFRGTGSGWMNHLHELAATGGFERSLTLAPQLAWVEAELARPENIWRDYLARWRLTTTRPFGGASVADPQLLAGEKAGRAARAKAATEALMNKYGTGDAAAAIAAYQKEYDAQSAALEQAGAELELPGFIDAPPMTLDDALVYETGEIDGVPMVRSTFASMTGGTVGAAFDLHGIAEPDLLYLPVLSTLLTEVGLYENGAALSHEEVTDLLRKEVLSVSVYGSTNMRTGRAELVARGAGNDTDETARALAWMNRFLHHADWRPENLSRIRDLVDQMTKSLRNRMNGAEEGWVNDPANIYLYQTDPLLARVRSFLTRSHDVHRLRWQLREAPDAAVGDFLRALATAGKADRKALETLTDAPDDKASWPAAAATARKKYLGLNAAGKALADEALGDLGQLLRDLPDDSLLQDWSYLCKQIAADLAVAPTEVLAGLARIRDAVVRRGGMRMFAIGSAAAHQAAAPGIAALIAGAAPGSPARQSYSDDPFVLQRLAERHPAATRNSAPVFVGLVNPNTQSGVFINSAPGFHYTTRDPEQLLRYLAGNLYTGHGAHSLFMKTWSAGLAYSNGLRGSLPQARIRYYAERCPELPQTLQFVVDELRKAERDDGLVDYAIAQAFSSRVAASFEGRGEAMAADLVDGVTPEVVKGFRQALMGLKRQHGDELGGMLFDRMKPVYGTVLPGYGPRSADVDGAVYFVIGPDHQLDLYQDYLRKAEGPDATLHRLYPRDYWVPAEVSP